MKVYQPDKPLISVHIPKCAGSSFAEIIREWFGHSSAPHYFHEQKNEMPTRYNFSGPICIHGHFNNDRGFGVEDYYPEAEQLITVIRDPFEVAVSDYFYRKKVERQTGRPTIPGKDIFEVSVKDYLEDNPNSHIMSFFPRGMDLNNYKEIIEAKYVYIGVSENMEVTVAHLAKKLGKTYQRPTTENPSKRDEDVPEVLRQKFRKDNPLEYAIYDYAVANYLE